MADVTDVLGDSGVFTGGDDMIYRTEWLKIRDFLEDNTFTVEINNGIDGRMLLCGRWTLRFDGVSRHLAANFRLLSTHALFSPSIPATSFHSHLVIPLFRTHFTCVSTLDL